MVSSIPISSMRRAVEGGDFGVGDDMVDVFHIGYFAEAAPSELGGVCQHNCFLCGLHHHAVEACFHHIGGGDAKVEVNAVHTDE